MPPSRCLVGISKRLYLEWEKGERRSFLLETLRRSSMLGVEIDGLPQAIFQELNSAVAFLE